MCVGENRRAWKDVSPAWRTMAALREPFICTGSCASDSQFPSVRPPPPSAQLLALWFPVFIPYEAPIQAQASHTCASPLPSSMLPTCLCNHGVLESLLRAFCLWWLCMSSPLSNLLDGLWLSCQFYDGTKTQEREGEQRIFGDWAVIRSRGQAGHQVCVADPISSAAQQSRAQPEGPSSFVASREENVNLVSSHSLSCLSFLFKTLKKISTLLITFFQGFQSVLFRQIGT